MVEFRAKSDNSFTSYEFSKFYKNPRNGCLWGSLMLVTPPVSVMLLLFKYDLVKNILHAFLKELGQLLTHGCIIFYSESTP